MGGAASHFGNTDWETSEGGVKEASDTFDGAKPTEAHSIFYLTKGNKVNQREFALKDEDNAKLYTTKAVEGTTKDFDVLSADATKLFHVHTNALRSQWEIYSYATTYEGQTPITDRADLKVEEPLYRKASVKIAWDKYHGVISLYQTAPEDSQGILSKEHLLRIEEIKSITPQFQSFVPAMSIMRPKLCGYWIREHTAKTDHIKMYLAKATDIALHGILAVITNIVHVEREYLGQIDLS